MFGSPTATLEVVGNTGNMSSEKAGVGGSTPSLATKSLTFSNLPFFLIRYIESIFHKSMIFDIRNPLYALRLISGRAQTRRAWRLPLNSSRWATLEGAVQSRPASALSRQWPGRLVPRRIRILSITCHSIISSLAVGFDKFDKSWVVFSYIGGGASTLTTASEQSVI